MKHLIISFFAVSFLLQACHPISKEVEPDEVAKKIFTPTELAGIGQMIHFVDSIVMERTQKTDINEAYHAYFDLLATCISEKELFPLFVADSLKFIFLESIDKEAFSSIWKLGISYTRKLIYKDSMYTDLPEMQCLGLNVLEDNKEEGKFMKYLKEIGNTNELYATLHDDFLYAGGISPSSVSTLLLKNQYDYTIYKDRLIAMVFLFLMEDPLDYRMERYLKTIH